VIAIAAARNRFPTLGHLVAAATLALYIKPKAQKPASSGLARPQTFTGCGWNATPTSSNRRFASARGAVETGRGHVGSKVSQDFPDRQDDDRRLRRIVGGTATAVPSPH
jgi:hypothetical protein